MLFGEIIYLNNNCVVVSTSVISRYHDVMLPALDIGLSHRRPLRTNE